MNGRSASGRRPEKSYFLNWQVLLGLFLIVTSAFLYLFHYVIFLDVRHIFIYMVGDIAFVLIEVLLVTLIIHRLLSEREKKAKLEKLNLLIGSFFSDNNLNDYPLLSLAHRAAVTSGSVNCPIEATMARNEITCCKL